MSIILDPLLDVNPDAYQVVLVKKILDKIKMHDDGLSISALSNAQANTTASGADNTSKQALQNLTIFNRVSWLYINKKKIRK